MAERSLAQPSSNERNEHPLIDHWASRPDPQSTLKIKTAIELELTLTDLKLPVGAEGEILDLLTMSKTEEYFLVQFPGLATVVKFPTTTKQITMV